MNHEKVEKEARFAWFNLNADGVLIAGLSVLAGLDLVRPNEMPITKELGYIPPSFFIWSSFYLIGGLLMLWGFAREQIPPEFVGRIAVFLGALFETGRMITAYGFGDSDVQFQYAVLAILLATFTMRFRTLFSERPLFFMTPGRQNNGDS